MADYSISCTMAGPHAPHDMAGGRCPGEAWPSKPDIVERLRAGADVSANGGGEWHQLIHRCREAADEIESLRETIRDILDPIDMDELRAHVTEIWTERYVGALLACVPTVLPVCGWLGSPGHMREAGEEAAQHSCADAERGNDHDGHTFTVDEPFEEVDHG